MGAKLQSWWQKIKHHPFIATGMIGLIALIFSGYWFHWAWTGFNKTLWNWMQLLLIFFSSRRRHTRFKCDWSSDVCSSDLKSLREKMKTEMEALIYHFKIFTEGFSPAPGEVF